MSFDLNAFRNEFTRLKSDGQSNFLDNFVPMPDGEGSVVIRLLPSREGPLPYLATRTHKINGKNVHCPLNLVNGRWQGFCPVCEHYKKLWRQHDSATGPEAEALKQEARAIKPVERYYWNAIVRTLATKSGDVQKNVGPKIFSCGKQLQFKLVKSITGDETVGLDGLGDVTDTSGQEGCDLRVIKRLVMGGGDEKYPNYNESVFLKPSPAGNESEVATWLGSLHDLNSLRRLLSNEELEREVRIHRGQEEDPELSYQHGRNAPKKDEVGVLNEQRPLKPARPSAPVPASDDDEALAEDDFLSKLRNI